MTKQELREKYKKKRAELAVNELEMRSQEVLKKVKAFADYKEACCGIFLPIERQKELNTYPIITFLWEAGAKVVVPMMHSNEEMEHYALNDFDQLRKNDWGIPEPVNGEMIRPEELDYVFVPLLVADRRGHRVGYGKGFYDRYLARCKSSCRFVGLSHFPPLECEISDSIANDVPLHHLITPERIYQMASNEE